MQSSAPSTRDRASKLDSTARRSDDPALVLCRDGEVVWASNSLAELLGCDGAPTFMGRPITRVLSEAASDSCSMSDISRAKTNQHQANVVRIATKNHKPDRYVSACRVPGSGSDSLAGHEFWLLSDVTESASVETLNKSTDNAGVRLENARKEFSQDRDELIALLSHELRTPLTVISGYSKLLLSGRAGELTDEQRRFLEESHKSCQRLDHFVSDLLEASHDHAASCRVTPENANIEDAVRGVIEFFLPLFEERDVTVDVDIQGELPEVRFDPNRIEQVLTNLIGNAVKYTKVGSVISIQVRAVEVEAGKAIELSVTDDGPGIAKSDIGRIFEPYVRGSEDRRGAGIGLGLAICRRIMEAHGGGIGVEMVPGRGSRFVVSLPAPGPASRKGY